MARRAVRARQAPFGRRPPYRPNAAGAVLMLACAAQFMVVLDVSVVNVALPSIQRALGFTAEDLPWVATAYALVFGGFLLLGGRLADLHGHRRVFAAGTGLFTTASLAGGLATDPTMLVAARALQGLGAAVLAPVTLTVLTVTFPEGTRRTRALAVWTAVSLAGGAAGNLIGGALTQYLTWRAAGAAFQVPMWYFLTLYMQNILHFGALETGLGFLPHTVLTLLVGLRVMPWLMRRVSSRTLIVVGVLIAAAGFAWQSRISAGDIYLSGVLGPAVLVSVGGGLFNTPLTSTVVSGVADGDAGAASGLMNTAKQIGGALGLASLVAATGGHPSTEPAMAAAYGRAFALTGTVLMAVAVLALALPARRDDAAPAGR